MRTENQSRGAGLFEKAFVFSVLLLSTGAFMSLTVSPGHVQDAASGQAGLQLAWMGIYAVAVVLLMRTCRTELKEACREYLLVALALFALSSTLWSDDPGVSLRRGVALVLTCLFGVYLGSRFTLREQLRLLAAVAGVCAVSSLVFGILKMGNAVEDIPDAWYGIFVHKNVLGRMMVLSIVVFWISAKAESEKKARYWWGAALAFILLLLAHSATSLAVLAAMSAFLIASPVLRRKKSSLIKAGVVIVSVCGLGAYWISQNLEEILSLFGKDLTLTGRLQLWFLSVVMAMQRPWLGHGYNAFWLGPGSVSERIVAVVQWDAPHAHNGLLELWLEIGLAGVLLFLVGFVVYVGRAMAFFRAHRAPENIWPLCFLIFMFISNITESDYLGRNTIFWIVYVAVVTNLRNREETALRFAPKGVRPSLLQADPRVCEG